MANVYEGLVKIDQEGKIQPSLAESWTQSDDRKSYTFTLRKDAKFSNGEAFTAADVKFSLERVKSRGSPASRRRWTSWRRSPS